MKKIAIAAAVAATLSAGAVQAQTTNGLSGYTLGGVANQILVPNVVHNGTSDTTAIGVLNPNDVPVSVWWTFVR